EEDIECIDVDGSQVVVLIHTVLVMHALVVLAVQLFYPNYHLCLTDYPERLTDLSRLGERKFRNSS
uniref:hypothetical protein n=1 Tax=Vibrio vulnificus TaxID=672 RepID=UPI0019D47A3F